MKAKTHPEYHLKTKVTCSCGNTFSTGSTLKEIKVELCNKCHPFYTGKQKLVETTGRLDKFKKRTEMQEEISKVRKGKKQKRIAKRSKAETAAKEEKKQAKKTSKK